MPTFEVKTGRAEYPCVVERGVLSRIAEYIPERAGKVFITTSEDVWDLHGKAVEQGLAGRAYERLLFPGGESNKRFQHVEALAEQMVRAGADRSSIVVAFGGGSVTV